MMTIVILSLITFVAGYFIGVNVYIKEKIRIVNMCDHLYDYMALAVANGTVKDVITDFAVDHDIDLESIKVMMMPESYARNNSHHFMAYQPATKTLYFNKIGLFKFSHIIILHELVHYLQARKHPTHGEMMSLYDCYSRKALTRHVMASHLDFSIIELEAYIVSSAVLLERINDMSFLMRCIIKKNYVRDGKTFINLRKLYPIETLTNDEANGSKELKEQYQTVLDYC